MKPISLLITLVVLFVILLLFPSELLKVIVLAIIIVSVSFTLIKFINSYLK